MEKRPTTLLQRTAGFTLVELMIAVVIIAILAAVALPTYRDSVRAAHRADARNALISAQLAQEKYRSNHSTYGAMGDLGLATSSESGYYTIAVASSSSTAYVMTATPAAGTAQAGDSCGTFAVNQNGPDTSGSYADSDCW